MATATFRFGDLVPASARRQVDAWCGKHLKGRATLENVPAGLGLIELPPITGLAGAILSAISLVLKLEERAAAAAAAQAWDLDRVKRVVTDGLAMGGTLEFNLTSIDGLAEFAGGESDVCAVNTADKQTGRRHRVYVFRQGPAYVVAV